ncbi:MAG: DNA primase [Cytophagales bacterium]|nr:DNA primase [Cytophagales bacterium]
MGNISKKTVDQIHNAIDIVDVINDFVPLKRKGKDMKALCPFHNEKTPSFSVSAARGIFKCFGCGKGGDAISFIKEYQGFSYYEALKYLANKYGIQVEEDEFTDEDLKQQSEIESLYIVMSYACKYYQELLFEHPEGKSIGMTYLKERGYNEKTIRDFQLGYSLNQWDAFSVVALKNGHSADMLEKAGLIIRKEAKQYDRFRERLIFPIHNQAGKVIAFGARILKSAKDQPKYVNSPETEIYSKSKVLYGIYQAKQAIRQEDNCYLVEGYTDVISLHQAGIHHVVASSGTSLTEDQVRLIARFSKNITILYDGDEAGIKASIRGVDMILEAGLNVKIIMFPEDEDPDSYLNKKGTSDFKAYLLNNQKNFITFITEFYLKDAGNDPAKKAQTIREVVTSISKIPGPTERTIFLKECSKLLEIDENTLAYELHKKLGEKRKASFPHEFPTKEAGKDDPEEDIFLYEGELIKFMMLYASFKIDEKRKFIEYVLEQIEGLEFLTPVYSKMLNIIKSELGKGNIPDENFFLKNEDEGIKNEAINLLSEQDVVSENWKKKHKIDVPEDKDILASITHKTIQRLKMRYVQKWEHENKSEMQKTANTKEIEQLQKVHLKLKEDERKIASELGNIVVSA